MSFYTNELTGVQYRTKSNKSVGQQTLTVTSTSAVSLTVPQGANSALLQVVDGGASDSTKVIRFFESGTAPTTSVGFILGELAIYEIVGADCISNFKAISIDGSVTHTLTVIYYSE